VVSKPRLAVDPDPAVWFVGPTDARPFEVWLPEAVDLVKGVFEIGPEQAEKEQYVTLVLERIGQPSESPLPYRVVRWLDLQTLPLLASFGMVERSDAVREIEEFLSAVEEAVETPIVEDVPGPDGLTIRRAVSYSDVEGGLLVQVRYVVDTGDDEVVLLVLAGARSPGAIVSALDDLDTFVRTAQIERD
jgi:hypothetical protein